MTSAIVVGSGPNGLAAAARLARAGLEVTVLEAADVPGGGTRTSEQIVPGLLHDHCSAVHQIAAGSPFFNEIDLGSHGLNWLSAPVDCVHPLDDGSAGVLHQSIERTVEALGLDGKRWHRLFASMSDRFDDLFADASHPVLSSFPSHPLLLARFGAASLLPATTLARLFRTDQAKALFGGVAAHTYYRLDRPLTSAVGMMLVIAGHNQGWVVAEGGSQSITDALVADIEHHRGRIETRHRVRSINDLPAADVVMLDVSPSSAAAILGDRLPQRIARSYRRFKHGPGAYKVDFAIEHGVPWTAPHARQAGTVHLGGTFAELAGHRESHPQRRHARPALRARLPAVSCRSRPVGRRRPPPLDLRPCAPRLHRRCHPGNHRSDRTIRAWLSRPHRGHSGAHDHRDVGVQRKLCGRRHHWRRIDAHPTAVPASGVP